MQKLLSIFLALALLVSSSGVTVAAVICKRQSPSKAMMCSQCRKAPSGISLASKSCCVKITKFIAVKSLFGKPAQHVVDLSHQVLPLLVSFIAPIANAIPVVPSFSPSSPPSSLEKCALTSTFRI